MKTVGLTLSSCIAIFGIAAFLPSASSAYQPAGPTAPPPHHATPAPTAAPKIPVPLMLRPPPVLTPDQGPNPSASPHARR